MKAVTNATWSQKLTPTQKDLLRELSRSQTNIYIGEGLSPRVCVLEALELIFVTVSNRNVWAEVTQAGREALDEMKAEKESE